MASQLTRAATGVEKNFGMGAASSDEATAMGRLWVGADARLSKDGAALVSRDGDRVFRFPSLKEGGETQANFITLRNGKQVHNAHLTIK